MCIAAGSGITPMLSVAATALAHPDARVTLLYGNRTTTSVMFAEELADLKDRHPARFDLVHVLSREPREVDLFTGRLDADRLRELLTRLVPLDDVDHVWLCGPHALTSAAQEVLAALGVRPEQVHVELFFVDEPPPELHRADRAGGPAAGETSEVTVVLDGRTTTGPMPKAQTVLDAAQRVRSDLPFACKGGVCGTCRARVSRGRGGDGAQLRPRAGRGRARVRADLPELPGQRRGHRRLRRLTVRRPASGHCLLPAGFWSLPARSGPETCGHRPEAGRPAGSDQKQAQAARGVRRARAGTVPPVPGRASMTAA